MSELRADNPQKKAQIGARALVLRGVAAGAAIAYLITGCSGSHTHPSPSSGSQPANELQTTIQNLQAQGKLPTLDVTAAVGGVDVNGNGLRDDLDAFIAAQGDSAAQKASLIQLAKALQTTLLVDVSDATSTRAAAAGVNRGVACVWSAYPDAAAPAKVLLMQQLTVNTMVRLTAYEKFNTSMSGSVIQYPAGVICDV